MTRPLALMAVVIAGLVFAPAAQGVYDFVPDLLTPEREYDEIVWTHDREEGSHLALHFSLPDNDLHHPVLRVVDADGDELLHAFATSVLYISDGYGPDGKPRYIAASSVVNDWYRVDIVLNGTTYTYQDDSHYPRGPEQVEARLFKEATTGAFANSSAVVKLGPEGTDWGPVAQTERERVYNADTRLTTFREGLEGLEDWSVFAPDGEMRVKMGSHLGYDRVRIEADTGLGGLTYLHTPAPDGAFVAEAVARPRYPLPGAVDGIPDHQAVLSALSGPMGEPEVDWAVVMAPTAGRPDLNPLDSVPPVPGQYWVWSLFFIDSNGTRTQIAPTWYRLDPWWHDVRVYANPATGAVEVQVDENETVLRFENAFTGASDRIATGDVWQGGDFPWWTGGRIGDYDNLAVGPVEGGP